MYVPRQRLRASIYNMLARSLAPVTRQDVMFWFCLYR